MAMLKIQPLLAIRSDSTMARSTISLILMHPIQKNTQGTETETKSTSSSSSSEMKSYLFSSQINGKKTPIGVRPRLNIEKHDWEEWFHRREG